MHLQAGEVRFILRGVTATEAKLRPVRVISPEVAKVFQNVREFQMLLHFMPVYGSTVSSLADAFGLALHAAFRKVKKFERLGLLSVLREERRAGRAVRHYICREHSFFLPRELLSLEEQMRETFEPYHELMRQQLALASTTGPNPVAGLIFQARHDGLWLIPANAHAQKWDPNVPGTPAFFHGSGPLLLDYPQAKALERELYELLDRYRTHQGSGLYLAHAFLTPVVGVSNFTFPHAGYTKLV
ncbi:hypothetical protein [Deinococcus peraridilitoris]|uniref:Uncharacterized protein n=1 Tax=Deinococcus peraridilitoris (strain DSM 19664 / LMG 22246 / CIP 109416 / KR-200) TaxID=937777 RepID=L0A1D8_DEIPD|nr:hypothetical protein [Deinococcus peraridilitoris]AFZ67708.1 hypothetical protein Deipe_2223 [Deinococcus peraridilitoris DSM 19664]